MSVPGLRVIVHGLARLDRRRDGVEREDDAGVVRGRQDAVAASSVGVAGVGGGDERIVVGLVDDERPAGDAPAHGRSRSGRSRMASASATAPIVWFCSSCAR